MNIRNVKQLGGRLGNGGRAKAQLGVDAAAIRELANLLVETGLTEIEIEQGGQRLRVVRQATAAIAFPSTQSPIPVLSEPVHGRPAAEPASGKRESPAQGAVSSPLVGTVYVAPEPGQAPFVKVGDAVKEGDTLLIVEAMKTMNPILAPRTGMIAEICIVDAQPVEFGQTLLILA